MCTAPFRKDIIPSHPCCWSHNFLAVVIIRVHEVSGVADPDPGCGIRCLFDPSIRDSNPESGMVKKNPDLGSGMNIRDNFSETWKQKQCLGLQIQKLIWDPESF
jgi:hypothetical protein